jgi:hypothetical protein
VEDAGFIEILRDKKKKDGDGKKGTKAHARDCWFWLSTSWALGHAEHDARTRN